MERYLEELTVRIESLTNLGEGIAREGEMGWVVMVPHVIPGELVKCKVFRNHANYSEATLVSSVLCRLLRGHPCALSTVGLLHCPA